MPTSKHFVFTKQCGEGVGPPDYDGGIMCYMVYQQERAPTTGQLHWQGFLSLRRAGKLSKVRAALGRGVHVEVSKDPAAAIEYCQKQDTRVAEPVVHGTRPQLGAGVRSDLNELALGVRGGKDLRWVAENYPTQYIRYSHGVLRLLALFSLPRDRRVRPSIYCLIGPTGAGKTRWAWDDCDQKGVSLYNKPPGKWWDGYEGESAVLFDDFDGDSLVPPTTLLQWCDRYPCRVEVKGAFVQLRAQSFIFTSTVDYQYWYQGTVWASHWQHQIPAFERRLRTTDTSKDLNIVELGAPDEDPAEELANTERWLSGTGTAARPRRSALRDGPERREYEHVDADAQ